jgi:uncharacterized tellurite resistance protein B-like protein
MNPFHWRRRRAWAKRYQGDPIYSVEDPVHVAALLILGAAKLDGDISAEQKKAALNQFKSNFSLDTGAASDLLGSATHLLGAPQVIDAQLKGLADMNQDRFSRDQAESMMQMMVEVASADGDLTATQSEYIEGIRTHFVPPESGQGTWS